MNTQSCLSASLPANRATPRLRAGFTDVLSIGMLMRWMSVSTRPIETPANPAENFQWKIAAISHSEEGGHHDLGDDDRAEVVATR